MTPKEKANELLDNYWLMNNVNPCLSKEQAKQCALITCNRTIDILKEIRDKEHSNNFWYLENAILEEMQVKKEIELL